MPHGTNYITTIVDSNGTSWEICDEQAYHGIPGNKKLTIKVAGATKGDFYADQSVEDVVVDITAADLGLTQVLKFIGVAQDTEPTAGSYIHDATTETYISITTTGEKAEVKAEIGYMFIAAAKQYVVTTAGYYATPNASTELGDQSAWAHLNYETSTPTNSADGTATITYSKAAAETDSANGADSTATSGAGSSHNHSVTSETTTIPSLSYDANTGILTILNSDITVVTSVNATTGNESAHTHNYTGPTYHTHNISHSDETATGSATVGSHTHTQK